MKIQFFIFSLLFSFSCSHTSPKIIIKNSTLAFSKGEFKKGCELISEIKISRLDSMGTENALHYLRITSLCYKKQGKSVKPLLSKLSEPHKSYLNGLDSFGSKNLTMKFIKIFDRLIKLNPTIQEFKYRLGLLHLLDENFDKACPLIKKTLNSSLKKQNSVRLSLARCYLGQGKLDKIAEILRPILNENCDLNDIKKGRLILRSTRAFSTLLPFELLSLIKTTKIYLKNESSGKALDNLQKFVLKYPKFAILRYLLGVVHLRLGNKADAVVELRKALIIDPNEWEAHIILGNLYINSSDPVKGEKHLKQSIKLNPFNVRARLLLRNLYIKRDSFKEGIKIQKELLYLNGGGFSQKLLEVLAELQEKGKLFKEAIETHRKIITKLGTESGYGSVTSVARLYLFLSLHDFENTISHRKKAKKFIEEANKLRPTDPYVISLKKELNGDKYKHKDPFEHKIKIEGAVQKDDTNLFE
jgi:tetratricopeptide (TPR) repeat protein